MLLPKFRLKFPFNLLAQRVIFGGAWLLVPKMCWIVKRKRRELWKAIFLGTLSRRIRWDKIWPSWPKKKNNQPELQCVNGGTTNCIPKQRLSWGENADALLNVRGRSGNGRGTHDGKDGRKVFDALALKSERWREKFDSSRLRLFLDRRFTKNS